MFAVIYQSYVKPGREEEYEKLWKKLATYFIDYRGALGSCLHKREDGLWVAYSRWPDRATREASWQNGNNPSEGLPAEILEVGLRLKDCLDETRKIPEICLDVVDDLLI